MSPRCTAPINREERARHARAIGHRIRQLRQSRGMTQSEVAGDRFSKAYISALENGVAYPSVPALHYIATRLQTSPEWFLTEAADGEAVALPALISNSWIDRDRVFVELTDGRALGLPLRVLPPLMSASLEALRDWRLVQFGRAISWPSVGAEIGLEEFLGMRVLDAEVPGDGPRRQRAGRARGRYTPFADWLAEQREHECTLSFDEVEAVIGGSLPPSARRYTAPWYSSVNPLARAIRAVGWRASVSVPDARVTLRRR